MSKVLLDTDILSEVLKGKSAVVTARADAYLAQQGRFTTSAISVAEIVYGFRRVGREDRVAQFEASLDTAEVLSLDDAAARLAGLDPPGLSSVGATLQAAAHRTSPDRHPDRARNAARAGVRQIRRTHGEKLPVRAQCKLDIGDEVAPLIITHE